MSEGQRWWDSCNVQRGIERHELLVEKTESREEVGRFSNLLFPHIQPVSEYGINIGVEQDRPKCSMVLEIFYQKY